MLPQKSCDSITQAENPGSGTQLMEPELAVGVIFLVPSQTCDAQPGPMCMVLGRELCIWAVEGLGLSSSDALVLAPTKAVAVDVGSHLQRILNILGEPRHKAVASIPDESGIAHALLSGIDKLPDSHRSGPVLVIDGSTCSFMIPEGSGSSPASTFRASLKRQRSGVMFLCRKSASGMGQENIDGESAVVNVFEESVVTDAWTVGTDCVTGWYGFSSGLELKEYCKASIKEARNASELGLRSIVSLMIGSQVQFLAISLPSQLVEQMHTWNQLEDFCRTWPKPIHLRIVWDFDALFAWSAEDTCFQPIPSATKFCHWLHDNGHTIVIKTSLGMNSHRNNCGAAVAAVGQDVWGALSTGKIKYHELAFGTPYGHIHVSDCAVDPTSGSLERLTGFYMGDAHPRRSASKFRGQDEKDAVYFSRSKKNLGQEESSLRAALSVTDSLLFKARTELAKLKEVAVEPPVASEQNSAEPTTPTFTPPSRVPSDVATMEMGKVTKGRTPLSIIIPMAGRPVHDYMELGLSVPIPMVNMAGQPLIFWQIEQLNLEEDDEVFIALPSATEMQFGIVQHLRERFKRSFHKVELSFKTCGWAETILCVLQQMTSVQRTRRLVSIDCHLICHGLDVLKAVRGIPKDSGGTVYFDVVAADLAGRFSFLRMDRGKVVDVREKVQISPCANVGVYSFPTGRQLRDLVIKQIDEGQDFFASALIQRAIGQNIDFIGIHCPEYAFHTLGSKAELEVFRTTLARGKVLFKEHAKTFCFNLEPTILSKLDDHGHGQPVEANVQLVKGLSKAGHRIVLETTRSASQGRSVFQSLELLKVPYDGIRFDKPTADVFVNDSAVSSRDLQQDLGWERCSSATIDGGVASRTFNQITAIGDKEIVKSSTSKLLRGEVFYFQNIPPSLADLFPRLVEIHTSEDLSQSYIKMERVEGQTFTQLLVNGCLTPGRLLLLMQALWRIHKEGPTTDASMLGGRDICANYVPKLKQRYEEYKQIYATFRMDCELILASLVRFAEEYQLDSRFLHAWYIHGSPNFSNCLLTPEGAVKLVDMRGELGNVLTTQGDVTYDLAKVYQCLCGYDFLLLDKSVDEIWSARLDELRSVFWAEVDKHYPTVRHRDVRIVTASLFFSMIPLHRESQTRIEHFLNTAKSILVVEGLL